MKEHGETAMGRVSVEVELANYQDVLLAQTGTLPAGKVRQVHVRGLVDSGATRLILPAAVVAQLGLPATGETTVRYADQRTATRPIVNNVLLKLQGREGTYKALVEPDRTDVLIGAIVLEDLDFVVDGTTQALHPRDPDRIVSEAE